MALILNGTTGISPVTAAGTSALVDGMTVGRGAGEVATNTAVGASALAANTTGSLNVAFGYQAGAANTTGIASTYVGYQAGLVDNGSGINTFVGYLSGAANTTGANNTALGAAALQANTTGATNVAIGRQALQANTTASNNIAVGYQAGYTYNGTSGYNTLIGYQAGLALTGTNNAGYANVLVGPQAGYAMNSTTASQNIYNTFVGPFAGNAVTTGSKNTIIGGYNGNQGGLNITTSNNLVVLSDGDGQLLFLGYGSTTAGRYVINDGGFFYSATDNVMNVGAPSKRWNTVYATVGTINTSDANQKQDIAALDDAEKRVAISIKSLIKKYRFKDSVAEKGDAARIHVGAVAQEVAAAFVAEGLDPARYALFCSDTWYEVDGQPSQKASEPFTAETPNAVEVTRLGLRYDELLAFVIAAI